MPSDHTHLRRVVAADVDINPIVGRLVAPDRGSHQMALDGDPGSTGLEVHPLLADAVGDQGRKGDGQAQRQAKTVSYATPGLN